MLCYHIRWITGYHIYSFLFKEMMCFLDIQHSYDCLKSVFDLLKDERSELIANVMTVDDMYEKMQENPYDYTLQGQFNSLTLMLPERVWVE